VITTARLIERAVVLLLRPVYTRRLNLPPTGDRAPVTAPRRAGRTVGRIAGETVQQFQGQRGDEADIPLQDRDFRL